MSLNDNPSIHSKYVSAAFLPCKKCMWCWKCPFLSTDIRVTASTRNTAYLNAVINNLALNYQTSNECLCNSNSSGHFDQPSIYFLQIGSFTSWHENSLLQISLRTYSFYSLWLSFFLLSYFLSTLSMAVILFAYRLVVLLSLIQFFLHLIVVVVLLYILFF